MYAAPAVRLVQRAPVGVYRPVMGLLACLLATLVLTGCGSLELPFITTPTPTPGPVPDGWTLLRAARAQVAVPSTWTAVEMTADRVDDMILRLRDSNPQMADIMERAKLQEGVLLMAVDPDSSRGFAANVNVVLGNRSISSLGEYWQLGRKRLEASGMETEEGDLRKVGGRDVLFASLTQTMRLLSSEQTRIRGEQAMVDLGNERYIVTLTFKEAERARYSPLLEQMMQTIRSAK